MKIISSGKKTFNGNCTRCGCIFEYEVQDIDGSDMVECPDCGHKNLHFVNSVPQFLYSNSIQNIDCGYPQSRLNPQITIS